MILVQFGTPCPKPTAITRLRISWHKSLSDLKCRHTKGFQRRLVHQIGSFAIKSGLLQSVERPRFPSGNGAMGTQGSRLSNIQPMKVIAPGYTQHAPASLNTIYRVELKPRNGKNRYCSLYVAKNVRSIYAKYYDGSRAAKDRRCDKTLGVKLPEDITKAEEALAWVQLNHLEKWLRFEGECNRIEDGNYWPASAHADHSLRATAAYRSYPHGTAGYAWRWYGEQVDNPTILPDGNELNKVGSPTQHKVTLLDCGNVLAIQLRNGDTLGHIDAEDLSVDIVSEALQVWMEGGRSKKTFRKVMTHLSCVLGYALQKSAETGVRRGPLWGQEAGGGNSSPGLNKEAPSVINPFNTMRARIDAMDNAEKILNPDDGPCDPFTLEELKKILDAFRRDSDLRHFWPLVGILASTGCRPTEACALRWSHVTGLWEGNTIGKVGVSRALKPELTGAPVRFAMGVKKDKRNHSQADKRFRKTKTGSIKTPKLMTLVPGYENLFEMSIQALHPVGGDGSFAFMELKEWRNRLVFQGPRASEDDFRKPYYWDNFSGRQWARALKAAGVRYRRPYNLRHSYVTNMIQVGWERISDVARWIGDDEVTVRTHYSGVVDVPAADRRLAHADQGRPVTADLSKMTKEELMAHAQEINALVMSEIASRS